MYRFAIDNQEELKDGIQRVLTEQYTYIIHQASIPQDIDTTVHEIRKTLKRVRAVLRLIRFDIGEELFHIENVKYRELARLVSHLRDLHVIICYLAECFESKDFSIPEDKFIRLIEYANKQKELELKHLTEKNILKHLKIKAKASIESTQSYPLTTLGPHTIQSGVTQIYEKCLSRITASQTKLDDHSRHQLRKEIKYLSNQMLLMQEVWPEFFLNYSSSLQAASELLGNDHNLSETVAFLEKVPVSVLSQTNRSILTMGIRNEQDQIHQEVWPLLGKIFTEDSESFVKRVKAYWLIGRE